jgi:hypothetical protein
MIVNLFKSFKSVFQVVEICFCLTHKLASEKVCKISNMNVWKPNTMENPKFGWSYH